MSSQKGSVTVGRAQNVIHVPCRQSSFVIGAPSSLLVWKEVAGLCLGGRIDPWTTVLIDRQTDDENRIRLKVVEKRKSSDTRMRRLCDFF
jgi:hypothetical protein